MQKKYVIITDAPRESMYNTYPNVSPEVVVTQYNHHQGNLGLIHPKIIDFYSDLENNLKKYKKPNNILSGAHSFRSATEMMVGPYNKEEGDIQILMPNPKTITHSEEGYFITIYRKGEFAGLNGLGISSVKKEAKALYKKHSLSSIDPLEEMIEDSWRHLHAFDILMKHKIDKIPVEIAYRKIDQERIDIEKEYTEGLRKADISSVKSQSAWFQPVCL